LDRASLV